MTARERFRRWVSEKEASGMSRTQIAAQIGISESALCKILKGTRGAGGRIATKIEAATAAHPEGPIRAADWYAAA